jgi:hypothetical protein
MVGQLRGGSFGLLRRFSRPAASMRLTGWSASTARPDRPRGRGPSVVTPKPAISYHLRNRATRISQDMRRPLCGLGRRDLATRLYDSLKPHVTAIVACNPPRSARLKKGNKSHGLKFACGQDGKPWHTWIAAPTTFFISRIRD